VAQSYHQTYPQEMWKTFIPNRVLVSERTLYLSHPHRFGAGG
jgi:hypothetical protein